MICDTFILTMVGFKCYIDVCLPVECSIVFLMCCARVCDVATLAVFFGPIGECNERALCVCVCVPCDDIIYC